MQSLSNASPKLATHILRITVALLLALGIGTTSYAQFSASVQGTVSDTSGAIVAGADVTLHNVDTGVNAASKTANSGFYRFSSVAPGNYTVVATSAGFKTSSVAVLVTTAETRGVDVTLQVAGDNTHVTVNTIATALNPEETRVQTTLSAEEIGRLPLPNRDVQQLIALTPGVVGFQNESPTNGYGSSIFAGNFSPGYSANGLGNNSNLFLIDDLPVNDAQQQGAALLLPNAEMIGQVALQTQTYSVENGTAASLQVAFTTKSGANALHGTIDYSYLSSNIGAAKDPISRTVSPFHQNLLLASLGGPIYKNHTFFFGSVEKQSAAIGTAAATNPYLTPQFAQWALSTFPNSGAAQGLVFAPPTRDIGGTVRYANDPAHSGLNTTCGKPPYILPCNMPV